MSPSTSTTDWIKPLRYAIRVPLVLLHAIVGLPLTLLAINPLTAKVMIAGESFEHRMIRWWQGGLARCFGFRLSRVGTPNSGATLFVANHVSWLDINLIHSQRMLSFVAKAEIARWPLIGWMATRAGTIYHQRGSSQSLGLVAQTMVDRLQAGFAVGVFPEGGTGPGDHVRTFHGRIFQSAFDANVPVQPVALRFTRDGQFCPHVAFFGGENFLQNFLRLLGEPAVEAQVIFLEPITDLSVGRRRVAEQARAAIAQSLGYDRGPRDVKEAASDELDALASIDAQS